MKLRYALPAAAAALALSFPATAIAEEAPNAEETQQQVETSQQEGTQQQENENQEPTVQEQIQQDLAEVPGLSEEQIARFNRDGYLMPFRFFSSDEAADIPFGRDQRAVFVDVRCRRPGTAPSPLATDSLNRPPIRVARVAPPRTHPAFGGCANVPSTRR